MTSYVANCLSRISEGIQIYKMKTMIINGSPRPNGNTSFLISTLKEELEGTITEISAYDDNIRPCRDCRHCATEKECAIPDDMRKIYCDDFDNFIIASPVYYGMLTGPMVSFASRLQIYHAAQPKKDSPRILKPKKGVLILTGGSKDNSQAARNYSQAIFHILNAKLHKDNIALVFGTDSIPAKDNEEACAKIREIALRINEE